MRKKILGLISKFYRLFLIILSMPVVLAEYFHRRTGEEYGVGFLTKLLLVFKMINNYRKIASASYFLEHLIMAAKILNIPKSVEGCVVECGSYKGGSTTNLSLVCELCNRQLEVFDSFEGLPEPSGSDKAHICADRKQVHTYSRGDWYGSLEEVKDTISKYGNIGVCNFNVGYFNDTMPDFKKKCAFAFLDVDLRESLETCLRYLWSLLQGGCCLFTHEAPHMEISSLFFDQEWWRINLDSDPPGLIGAGCGLGLLPASGGYNSSLGYTIKNPDVLGFQESLETGLTEP